MVSPRLFPRRRLLDRQRVVLLAGFALLGFVFFNTLYFQAVQGWSPLQAGCAACPTPWPWWSAPPWPAGWPPATATGCR
jgi:hypothetical protein